MSRTSRTAHRLKFVRVEVERGDDERLRGVVELHLPDGGEFVGRAEHPRDGSEMRCAAQAAIDAIQQVVAPDDHRLEVLGVRSVAAFDANVVIVALAVHIGGEVRRLVGSCLAEDHGPRGAALAVLNATNRYLGVTLFAR